MDNQILDIVKQYTAAPKSGNRPVKGPGTGKSDSIPAVLNGDTPAALSDGEFVIKADTVSKAGGGSTDPGFAFFEDLTTYIDKMTPEQAAEFTDVVLNLADAVLYAGSGGPADDQTNQTEAQSG